MSKSRREKKKEEEDEENRKEKREREAEQKKRPRRKMRSINFALGEKLGRSASRLRTFRRITRAARVIFDVSPRLARN